jgi:signal transduction histidine kinase
MSLLEALQLIGFSLGAVLPLWMGYSLLRQRLGLVPIQRILLGLALCMAGWHASNLVITLRGLLGLEVAQWTGVLRVADTVAVVSITLCYSLLLHIHLYLWAGAKSRPLTRIEHLRVWLSYIPCLFLFVVVPRIWQGSYQPMLTKLSPFVLPFAVWIAYSLAVVAVTELLVARRSQSRSERRILRTLAFSFIGIAGLVLAALGFGLGKGTQAGLYLNTLANLGSLVPSALLAYYIYRYRYLELIIKESFIVAVFAAVVLAVYLYGIRRIGDWANTRFGLRAGVIEAILILALTLIAAPLRGWLERSFRALFERETALYRDVVARIAAHAGQYRHLPELLHFIESQTAAALSLRRVKIVLGDANSPKHDFDLAYPLTREGQTVGAMLIVASANALTPDVKAVLEVLAGQVAIAIEDCRLVEENLRLERKVAAGERLAALGQMAATVAHEVKNPLSAIKSIAQVMREDESLNENYGRDLNVIVGETDRLSQSVTQMLTFASKEPPAATPARADELVRRVVELLRVDADERQVSIVIDSSVNIELDGVQTASVRDALSNLALNALQATPAGASVKIECAIEGSEIVFTVTDSGPGIANELRQRIWEPFFTTKQRGTGLGLAIVRKRMEEAGGSAGLAPSRNGEGARFELRLPIRDVSEARP